MDVRDMWAPLKIQSSKQGEARAKNVDVAYVRICKETLFVRTKYCDEIWIFRGDHA